MALQYLRRSRFKLPKWLSGLCTGRGIDLNCETGCKRTSMLLPSQYVPDKRETASLFRDGRGHYMLQGASECFFAPDNTCPIECTNSPACLRTASGLSGCADLGCHRGSTIWSPSQGQSDTLPGYAVHSSLVLFFVSLYFLFSPLPSPPVSCLSPFLLSVCLSPSLPLFFPHPHTHIHIAFTLKIMITTHWSFMFIWKNTMSKKKNPKT